MIVADTGPIIAFARIGRLDLLHQVVGDLVIPEAVYEDLVIKGKERPGAAEVERSTWIHRQVVTDRAALALLPSSLHLGEREAIVLAQELGAQLLIDERRGKCPSPLQSQGLSHLTIRKYNGPSWLSGRR